MSPFLMLLTPQKHGAATPFPQVGYDLVYVAIHSTVGIGCVLYINDTRSAHPLKIAHKAEHELLSSELRL